LTHQTNAFYVNLLCWWNFFFSFLDLDSSLVKGKEGKGGDCQFGLELEFGGILSK
jgi:hypothetical protein